MRHRPYPRPRAGRHFPFSLFPIGGMERREGASEGLRDPPLGRPCDREPRTPCEDVRRSCENRLRPPGAPFTRPIVGAPAPIFVARHSRWPTPPIKARKIYG